jgi:hypothetical protein
MAAEFRSCGRSNLACQPKLSQLVEINVTRITDLHFFAMLENVDFYTFQIFAGKLAACNISCAFE